MSDQASQKAESRYLRCAPSLSHPSSLNCQPRDPDSKKFEMATGIETAGIVLAVLPIFVQMLGAYLDATGNHRCRKALLRELRVESALFKNTCVTLLEGLGADKVTRLLDGEEWNDPGLLELLGDRLGHDNAKLFVEYVQELSSSLSELGRKLGFESLDGNMKVRQ
jgi:hypothetical protein